MQEIYRQVGWKLMNLRQGKYLTQTQLGNKIGLSKYQVSRLEKGFGDTTLRNIHLACQFFEISMEELFQKEEKVKIDMAIRTESFEKYPKGLHCRNFSKALNNLAKIRIIEVPHKTARSIRVEPDSSYEFLCMKGSISIRTYNDSITMKPEQIVSLKGDGYAKLLNIYEEPSSVLIFAY